MDITTISKVHELFLELNEIQINKKELETKLSPLFNNEHVSTNTYIDQLIESGIVAQLAYFKYWVESDELIHILDSGQFPVLIFTNENGKEIPVILHTKNNTLYAYSIYPEGHNKQSIPREELLRLIEHSNTEEKNENKILLLTVFPNEQLFSEQEENDAKNGHRLSTLERFFKIIRAQKQEIGYIYIYAIISGIIGLSLPLGIQSIIGFISSGQISTSVIVLISFVILGILITGGLQVMQLSLVEHIQQRLFTKTAFEFAFRIPKIKIESVLKIYPPELMNRFFDIITLQKGLAKVLLESSTAFLQIVLGLMLLSLYHFSFIFFGIFLVGTLLIIIRFTAPKGLKTSLKESKHKYEVANWLEEIARALSTFKLAGYSNLPLQKTDAFVSNYLHARKSHFSILITQYISFVLFKTLITGGLLIMGCLLLVDKQINIGQFVASEIVVILIMNAVEKLIIQLDTIYDVMTSIEKIAAVTDLPIDLPKGVSISKEPNSKGLSLKIVNLKYKYPSESDFILKGINLTINASERICLSGYSSSGKTTFINSILGFLTSYEGIIAFDNTSLRSINKNSLIQQVGDNISQEDLFDGSLLENISLGKSNITLQDIMWAVESVGLMDFVQSQPNGLHTRLISGRLGISESVARKIIIARSIVSKPKLLILEDVMMGLEKESKLKLIQILLGKEFNWTLLIISNDEEIMKLCDRTIIMKEGLIVTNGKYEDIKNDAHFKELI